MFIEISAHGKDRVANRLGIGREEVYRPIYDAWRSKEKLPQWAERKRQQTEKRYGRGWYECHMLNGNLYIFHYRASVILSTGKQPRFLTILTEREERSINPHNFDKIGNPLTND